MEPEDQFANFRGAAAPFDWESLLHGGKSAAVSRSGVDADGWANTVQKERARNPSAADGGGPVSFMEAVLDCSPKMGAGAKAPLVVYLCGGSRAEVASIQAVPILARLILELSHIKSGPLKHA